MKTHLKTHAEKAFKCDKEGCDQSFHTPSLLKTHKFHHLTKELFTCSKCPKKFKTVTMVKKHEKEEHLLERKYYCSHCLEIFPNLQSRLQHKKFHRTKQRVNRKNLQKKVLSIFDISAM
jgi:KRAB domain-containing zinc finger protein